MTHRVEQLAEGVTLYLGDCREILPTLGRFDCGIVDPPYGETNLGWDRRVIGWPTLLRKHIVLTGSIWVFGSQRMFLECAREFWDGSWKFAQDVIWEKHNGSALHSDRFRRVHELALHFYPLHTPWTDVFKSPQYTYDAVARTVRKTSRPAHWHGETGGTTYESDDGGPRLQRSVIYARSEHGRAEHPTQKPTEIVEPLARYSCPLGGTILDPMMGAGTVGVVARGIGCGFVGIEGNEEFFDIACRRISEALKQPDLFIEKPKSLKQEVLI